MRIPRPAAAIEAIPPTTPFVGPEELARAGGHRQLLRLGANESAFGISPNALAAMQRELPHLSWYGDPESIDLREALAQRHECSVANVAVASGIDDLMGLAVRAFVSPGSVALTTRGSYPTFNFHVIGYGGALEYVEYTNDGKIDVETLAAAARRIRPAIVYVASPDNPSGSVSSRSDVEGLLRAIPSSTVLLLDEAYAEFAAPQDVMQNVVDGRLIRMRTFSKAYGMAGARIGYAITTPRIVGTFQKIRLHYGVNRNAQIGALAALSDQKFVQDVIRQVAQGREDYMELARSLGLAYQPSATNFVCIGLGSAQRATSMVNNLLSRGVFIRKPTAPPLDSYVRVTVGTTAQRMAFAQHFRALLGQVVSA
ncbi:MAG: aminotransferase class I/II-fold pyridoxal phosphate-dependent enzyme [Candidatus Eremiobacteraeota bacterium]|nr:aminotransferase class I/II-fold pyridoxal phosphate-dependent enzyme [Candidatus Eremiobacteraeota bacterium]